VRAALNEPTTPVTEALAAMGRVCPFFERAGMTAYPRPAHAHDQRLIDALRVVGLSPNDLAALERTQATIEALPAPRRRFIVGELRRWAKTSRRSADAPSELRDQLAFAQQRLLLRPVYYVKRHEVDKTQRTQGKARA